MTTTTTDRPDEATVHTQTELDAAIAAGTRYIHVKSKKGLLKVSDSGSSRIEARDSSRIEAWDSSSVEAWGSSSVEARGSSSVEAWDSSSVVARDSSSVVARGPFVVVRQKPRWAGALDNHGAVVIDERNAEPIGDIDEWVQVYGARRDGDTLTLFKATGTDFEAGEAYRLTHYVPGSEVVAEDWDPTPRCGGGLHLGPTASCATYYRTSAARWVEVEVDVADVVVIPESGAPKVKVRACRVIREVDRRGRPVEVTA